MMDQQTRNLVSLLNQIDNLTFDDDYSTAMNLISDKAKEAIGILRAQQTPDTSTSGRVISEDNLDKVRKVVVHMYNGIFANEAREALNILITAPQARQVVGYTREQMIEAFDAGVLSREHGIGRGAESYVDNHQPALAKADQVAPK